MQAGSAPGNWAAKRQKGGKSIPALFCEPNLSWQQNVPFVIKAAFLGQVISHCLSLEWTTALPSWLWIITSQMFCLHGIVLRWLRCWLVGPPVVYLFLSLLAQVRTNRFCSEQLLLSYHPFLWILSAQVWPSPVRQPQEADFPLGPVRWIRRSGCWWWWQLLLQPAGVWRRGKENRGLGRSLAQTGARD